MDAIWDIFSTSFTIFILVTGVLGLLLSFFLMLTPELTRNISRRLDYWINVDDKLRFLDAQFSTDGFVFRHNMVSGIALLAGSIFLTLFLFYELDTKRLSEIFTGGRQLPVTEIVLTSAIILGKVAGFAGILLGFCLLFASGKIRGVESKMASDLSTQPLIDKLNAFHGEIDSILLRYPVVIGLAGLGASVLLTLTGSYFLIHA